MAPMSMRRTTMSLLPWIVFLAILLQGIAFSRAMAGFVAASFPEECRFGTAMSLTTLAPERQTVRIQDLGFDSFDFWLHAVVHVYSSCRLSRLRTWKPCFHSIVPVFENSKKPCFQSSSTSLR